MNRDTLIGLTAAFLVVVFILFQPRSPQKSPGPDLSGREQFTAVYGSPLLDGSAADSIWETASWYPLDQTWIGTPPAPGDFSGRYKLAWDDNNLYVLAEITDDTLMDIHPDGLVQYWDDDCLEIFLDEDASGGDHQYNYNAFAYHVGLDGKVADIGPSRVANYYNDHCTVRRNSAGKTSVWEVAVKIFDGKNYTDGGDNIPKMLSRGKKMGFALAYCDNDHSPERENFVGSVRVEGEDKNRGWIDAGIFGALTLK